MARYFVYHDEEGRILSVAKVERQAEGMDHPFAVGHAEHGVVELDEGDPALAKGIQEVQESMRIDVGGKRLVAKAADVAEVPRPRKAAAKTKRSGAKKSGRK